MAEKESTGVTMAEYEQQTELLKELIGLQKKQRLLVRGMFTAVCAIALTLIIAALILVPQASSTLAHVDSLLRETDQLITDTSDLVTETNEIVTTAGDTLSGIDTMVENVNTLVTENTEAVSESITKINDIDFESLNNSIRELADVLKPLQNFANLFKKD